MLIENFAQEGGQGGLPLGSFPLWGSEGVTLTTTTEDLKNNSYIEDFYRPAFLFVYSIPKFYKNVNAWTMIS
jgi:hypothetical protein